MVEISVIIPTFRDTGELALCLGALQSQTAPKQLFEIIIINNDSENLIDIDSLGDSNIQVIVEPLAGSYAARNAGVRAARGRFLAFTDSDCIPGEDWLANALVELRCQALARVAGAIQIFRPPDGGGIAFTYERLFSFRQEENVKRGVCVTANLFVSKEIFKQVGFFRQVYSNGDIEWNERASRIGIPIVYSERVVVRHPSRKTVRALLKKERRRAGGYARDSRRSWGRYIWTMIKPPVNQLRSADLCSLSCSSVVLVFCLAWFFRIASLAEFALVKANIKSPSRV
jgi:glycosyltransferase involved in cell wall biosynthesis